MVLSLALFFPARSQDNLSVGRGHLKGRVVNEKGIAIQGVTVFVYSAGPKVGTSSFCPTCYVDCRKKTDTDAEGQFEIASLDPGLIFRLLVAGKGYKPIFVPKVDPFKGPMEIAVQSRTDQFPRHQSLRGQILDPKGKPVPRAIISFEMFNGLEANCGGQCDGVDLVSVADAGGNFIIGSEKKFEVMDILVEVPGYARRKFLQLSSDKTHQLEVSEGVKVTGRILKDGKPAANMGVGLQSESRTMGDAASVGNFDTFSDADGNFTFFNIPSGPTYFLYNLMGMEGVHGYSLKKIPVKGEGSTLNTGPLLLTAGVSLKGKVILSDGKKIPPKTRILLGRNDAWDTKSVIVEPDGAFDFGKVPMEEVGLSVRVPGYFLSSKNWSYDWLNGFSIIGKIEHDTQIELLLEPGEFQRPGETVLAGRVRYPQKETLRGVESK